MPAARYKLLGKYRTPTFRYGQRVEDERRGEVRIVGLSAGSIPWPIGQTKRTKSLVLYRDLARAVRRESVVAIRHWWGVGANAVRKWRKALDVPLYNEGTRAWRVAFGKSKANRPTLAAMHAKAQDPVRRAKIGASRLGKPRPPEVIEALRKANIGRFHGWLVISVSWLWQIGGWIDTRRADFDQQQIAACGLAADTLPHSYDNSPRYVFRY